MSGFKEALRRDDDFLIIVAIIGILGVIAFWPDITEWFSGLLPTASGIARFLWQGLGILIIGGVLLAVYFATGMAGRRRPSGAYGIAGIFTGFLLLIFVAAYLYSAGFVLWFALLGGIAASLLLKILFAYWRTRLTGMGGPAPGTLRSLTASACSGGKEAAGRGEQHMRARNRQTRGRSPWLAALFLICAWPLISGWSLFRDEGESAANETKDECLKLAIEFDETHSGPMEWVDDIVFGREYVSEAWGRYDAKCESRQLRGCLLPPEKVTKVEEYKYRKRHCQAASEDCRALRERVSGLQREKIALAKGKNQWCTAAKNSDESKYKEGVNAASRCRHDIRRVAAVLDAIAVNETFFERQCFD